MKFQFEENETYKTRVPITIKEEGKYEGLKFVYGTIKFVEVDEDDENMGLNFAYEILENPNNVDEDQELVDTMGDILVDVLESEMGEINEGNFLSEE
tara:strand:+ start:5752 stop:6042 length:291 start_codon:yes stop_codon:yes gene_type:complete